MRIAGLVIGLIGSFAGFAGSVIALLAGGVAGALGDDETGSAIAIAAFVALVFSVVGLVGAALSIAKPRLAAGMMVASALAGVIAISLGYIAATVLLLIAALLAFLGRNERKEA